MALSQAFTRYENELLPEERTPVTGPMEALLGQALAMQAERQAAEAERKAASEALKRLDAAAVTAVRQIRLLLGGRFAQTPELAQGWGFTVRQTGRSAGYILMPRGQDEVRLCLEQYIEAELARPLAEQFTTPVLADMVALRDDIEQQWQARNRTEQRRLQANAGLGELCQQLSGELRRALSYLIMVNYDGQADRELGQWGFRVISRTSGNPVPPNGAPFDAPADAPEDAPDGDPAAMSMPMAMAMEPT
jgi:hypothetical protein